MIDIFWSLPTDLKLLIFENLTKKEQKSLCYKSSGTSFVCEKYSDLSSLGRAVKKGNLEKVSYLLKMGANINGEYYSPNLMTSLSAAIMKSDYPMVKLLLEKGADINAKSRTYVKPWLLVDDVRIAELLLNYGADINEVDDYGNTLLFRAVEHKNLDLINFLVEKGLDINHTNNQGSTAIMKHINPSHNDVIELLLKLGLNPNIKNKDGLTALDVSYITLDILYLSYDISFPSLDKMSKIIKLLLKYGAKRGKDL
jgi:ankyrin repeat protein